MHILYFLISRPHQHRAAAAFPIAILNKSVCHFGRGRSVSVSLFGPITTGPSPVWRHQTNVEIRNNKQIIHSLSIFKEIRTKTTPSHLPLSYYFPQKQTQQISQQLKMYRMNCTVTLNKQILLNFTEVFLCLLNCIQFIITQRRNNDILNPRMIGRRGNKENEHDLFMTRVEDFI